VAKRKNKAEKFLEEDAALLGALGAEAKVKTAAAYTPRQERIIAGFEEIQRFADEHGHPPRHGEGRDIFERLYAVRLDRIRASPECLDLLKPMDPGGLLSADAAPAAETVPDDASDEELLDALGVDAQASDVTKLKHVRSRAEIKAAEEVAQRTPCDDFETFRPLFEQVQHDLDTGNRRTAKLQELATVDLKNLFILDGQKILVAEMGEPFMADYNRKDRRLRIIYDNGTESDLLLRSLQRAFYKDDKARRILPADYDVPRLFSNQKEDDDTQSGHIYVLRSLSDHPFIAEHRAVIHKIGVTGGDVKKRVANAEKDPTFLLAGVEIVETYALANINRHKLEQLLHQFFQEARIDLKLLDRFGAGVEPREWFLVPLQIINQAIELLMSGEIENCRYDTESAKILGRRAAKKPV